MKSKQLPALFSAIALFTVSAQAQKPVDPDSGIVYETVTQVSTEGVPFSSQRTRTIETSRGTRLEVLERSGPGAALEQQNPMAGGPGSYMVTTKAAWTMFLVDTVKREYFEIKFDDMSGMMSNLTRMISSMNMKMSGMKIDANDLGDGGIILGHPTNHWKMHQTMTTSMSQESDTFAVSIDMFIDTWYAKDIAPVAPQGPLNSDQLKPDSAMWSIMRGFLGEDSTKTMEVYERIPKTLPLKVVTEGSMEMGPADIVMKTTREVTKLERGKFDAALFQVPKGYKLVEAPFPALPSTERSPDKPF